MYLEVLSRFMQLCLHHPYTQTSTSALWGEHEQEDEFVNICIYPYSMSSLDLGPVSSLHMTYLSYRYGNMAQ